MNLGMRHLSLLASLGLAACSQPMDAGGDIGGDEAAEDELSSNGAQLTLRCKSDGGAAKVVVSASASAFDLKATINDSVVFEAFAQRPSLNVRLEDGERTTESPWLQSG